MTQVHAEGILTAEYEREKRLAADIPSYKVYPKKMIAFSDEYEIAAVELKTEISDFYEICKCFFREDGYKYLQLIRIYHDKAKALEAFEILTAREDIK